MVTGEKGGRWQMRQKSKLHTPHVKKRPQQYTVGVQFFTFCQPSLLRVDDQQTTKITPSEVMQTLTPARPTKNTNECAMKRKRINKRSKKKNANLAYLAYQPICLQGSSVGRLFTSSQFLSLFPLKHRIVPCRGSEAKTKQKSFGRKKKKKKNRHNAAIFWVFYGSPRVMPCVFA